MQLESKADMRSRGLPSPDRADAVLGCLIPAWAGGWTAETLKQVFIGANFGTALAPRMVFTPRFSNHNATGSQSEFEENCRQRGIVGL